MCVGCTERKSRRSGFRLRGMERWSWKVSSDRHQPSVPVRRHASTGSPVTDAIRHAISSDGSLSPESHRETGPGVTPSRSANSDCVQPSCSSFSRRSSAPPRRRATRDILPADTLLSNGNEVSSSLRPVARVAVQDAGVSTFAERMEEAMKNRAWQRSDLASASGVSEPTISRYMTGGREHPRIDQLAALARALDVTLGWLYDGSGPRSRPEDGDPEIAAFAWPASTPEPLRLRVIERVVEERGSHRKALVPYWHERMRRILEDERHRPAT